MPPQSTRPDQPPSKPTRRYAPILFGVSLFLIGIFMLSLPLSANVIRQQQIQSQQSKVRNPLPPAVANAGLPYETRQSSRQGPERTSTPDAFGYVFVDEAEPCSPTPCTPEVSYSWISTTNRITDTAWQRTRSVSSTFTLDDGVMTTTLPFDFPYYGSRYNQLHISTNGNVHFGAPNDWYPDQSAACLPYNSQYVPQGMLAPLWYDFVVPSLTSMAAGVYTSVIGSSPNMTYVIEWHGVYKYSEPSSRATFEVLIAQNGEMRFQYQELVGSNISGGQGVVGIQNLDGSTGLPYSCYVESVVPGRAIRYRIRQAVLVNPSSAQHGGAPGATLIYTHTLLNQTGRDNTFTITPITFTWTTTVQPSHTMTVTDGMTTPITITVQIPSDANVGDTDQETIQVGSDTPNPGAFNATVTLLSSVSSHGVDFSPTGQTRAGAYGATVTYTAQLVNRSPYTNDFTINLVGNQWPTTVSPGSLTNIPPDGSAPIVVSATIPTFSTLGASDVVTLTARGQFPNSGDYFGVTIITTTAGSWDRRANMPVSRSRGAGVLFPDNQRIYALGGETYGGYLNIPVEEYDAYDNIWTTRSNLAVGVSNVGAAVIGSAIYVPGGYNGQLGGAQRTLQAYYPLEGRSEVITTDPLPAPRMGAGVAAANGKLYVFGGSDNSLSGTNTVYEYDPGRAAGSRWATKSAMPSSRVYLAAATLTSTLNVPLIYAVGGMPGAPTDLATVEEYNPNTDTWIARASMRTGRAGLALVGVDYSAPGCGGFLYALGGGWQSYKSSVERYNPLTNSWQPVSSMTSSRRSLGAAYSPSTFALVAFGGWSGQYEIVTESAQCSGSSLPPSPTPTATACPINFRDVHSTDYFAEAVCHLATMGAISGYSCGTGCLEFRPYNLTTRGQLAKIVTLAEGFPIYTPPTPTFRDVPADHAFYQYIETAYDHGIISGYSCGAGCLEFRPGNNVTRGQLCKIVVLAEGWALYTPPTPTFRDVPTTDPFYAYIETAYFHGIISGYSCGTGCRDFLPGNSATRGQISKIVYNALVAP